MRTMLPRAGVFQRRCAVRCAPLRTKHQMSHRNSSRRTKMHGGLRTAVGLVRGSLPTESICELSPAAASTTHRNPNVPTRCGAAASLRLPRKKQAAEEGSLRRSTRPSQSTCCAESGRQVARSSSGRCGAACRSSRRAPERSKCGRRSNHSSTARHFQSCPGRRTATRRQGGCPRLRGNCPTARSMPAGTPRLGYLPRSPKGTAARRPLAPHTATPTGAAGLCNDAA